MNIYDVTGQTIDDAMEELWEVDPDTAQEFEEVYPQLRLGGEEWEQFCCTEQARCLAIELLDALEEVQ